MQDFFRQIIKFFLAITIDIIPVELFNRLCHILPSTLVVWYIRKKGATIGDHVCIMAPIVFHNWQESKKPFVNLAIGDYCYIGRECFFDLANEIIIEDHSTISMGVYIITHTDVGESPIKQMYLPESSSPVKIHVGAYVGARATILQGVEIGSCSTIAAGSVVNTDIPPQKIYGGVPARLIKDPMVKTEIL